MHGIGFSKQNKQSVVLKQKRYAIDRKIKSLREEVKREIQESKGNLERKLTRFLPFDDRKVKPRGEYSPPTEQPSLMQSLMQGLIKSYELAEPGSLVRNNSEKALSDLQEIS